MNVGGILTLLVGLGLGCVGFVQMWRIGQLRRSGVTAVGTVVGHDEITDDGPMYTPVITFVDEDGVKRQFMMGARTSWRIHRIGQEVPVRYPAGRPDAPRLSSFTYHAWAVGLPLAVGALFAFFGVLGLRQG
jgi:hypothetical protein